MTAHALMYQPICTDAVNVYHELFVYGHSAVSARHAYEAKLIIEYDRNLMETSIRVFYEIMKERGNVDDNSEGSPLFPHKLMFY